MKLNNFEIERLFNNFKSVKIRSNDEYNRKLYILEQDSNKQEILTRLHYLNSDLSVESIFSREEVDTLIGKLRYGESIIVSRKYFYLFTKYYVIDLETLHKYPFETKEEYFELKKKPKRK